MRYLLVLIPFLFNPLQVMAAQKNSDHTDAESVAKQGQKVTTCASQEGVHAIQWDGKPYASKVIHASYRPLGYEVEPNCPEKLYELIKQSGVEEEVIP